MRILSIFTQHYHPFPIVPGFYPKMEIGERTDTISDRGEREQFGNNPAICQRVTE